MKSLLIRIALSICLFPFLFGCSERAKGQQKAIKAAAMDTYLSQEHRFEIKGCQLFYNDQHVVLDSLHKFEKIFGEDYNSVNFIHKFYSDKPVEIYLKGFPNAGGLYVDRINILMSHKEKYNMNYSWDSVNSLMPSLEGYILYDGVLVDKNTRIEDLNEQLRAKGKHMLSTALSTHNQGIAYECEGCSPGPNCTGLTYISLFYNESPTGGLGNIKALRYFYEH